MFNDGTRFCHARRCKKLLSGKQKKFCGRVCKGQAKRERIKRMAVEYKGGKCQTCGYDKCVLALDFHHRDPHTKEFNLSKCRTWKRAKIELDKCDILCSNCHRELHDKEFMCP